MIKNGTKNQNKEQERWFMLVDHWLFIAFLMAMAMNG